MPTKNQLEEKALAEYTLHKGKTVLVNSILGYDASDNSAHIQLNTPAAVRVDVMKDGQIICWNDDWLDPVWDVTLMQSHPQLEGIRSLWIHGTSYHPDGQVEPGAVIGSAPFSMNVDEIEQALAQVTQALLVLDHQDALNSTAGNAREKLVSVVNDLTDTLSVLRNTAH